MIIKHFLFYLFFYFYLVKAVDKAKLNRMVRNGLGCTCSEDDFICISQCLQARILTQAQEHIDCSRSCQKGSLADASACLLNCQSNFYSKITEPIHPTPTKTKDNNSSTEIEEPTESNEDQKSTSTKDEDSKKSDEPTESEDLDKTESDEIVEPAESREDNELSPTAQESEFDISSLISSSKSFSYCYFWLISITLLVYF